jgi:hypothetical protein
MRTRLLKVATAWLVLALVLAGLILSSAAVTARDYCPCEVAGQMPSDPMTLYVDVSPGGSGDVDIARNIPESYPASYTTVVGDVVRLIAKPAAGYYFVGWSGDICDSDNPAYARMNCNLSVTAHFFPEEIFSNDTRLHLVFPIGTVIRDKHGEPIMSLDVHFSRTQFTQPLQADMVGQPYEVSPDGASFDQLVSLSCSYDPVEIPEGVAEEELYLAYYDEDNGQWLELSSVVDTANHVVTAPIDHLSVFSILAPIPPPLPASFSASSLTISPPEVDIGEAVGISILVTNGGEAEGSYDVVLTVNGEVVETKGVTMAGGSQTVSFNTTWDAAGSYAVDVNGLPGSFTVREALVPTTASNDNSNENLSQSSDGGFPSAVKWTLIGLAIAALLILIIGFIAKLRRSYDDYYYY